MTYEESATLMQNVPFRGRIKVSAPSDGDSTITDAMLQGAVEATVNKML